jgi:hypothetical protein
MSADRFDEYDTKGGHHRVEGWIDEGALSFLALVNHYQMTVGITGAIAEIGVHHGRCFIALCTMRRGDEFGVAADIFENQTLNPDSSGHGDRARFVNNLQTFGVTERLAILTSDSLTLTGEAIVDAAHGQPVRLFSVDGAHTAEHTANDLTIAQDALSQRGVVVVDDWFNPNWPGVQEGLFDFMRQPATSLAPFAYGNNKLYLTKPESHGEYFAFVARTVRPLALHYKEVVSSGFRCHHLLLPPPDRVLPALLTDSATELAVANPLATSGTLGGGWGDPESWGRWTVGPAAEFTMVLPPGETPNLELSMEMATFLGGDRKRQVVAVDVEGEPAGDLAIGNTEFEWKRLSLQLPAGHAAPTATFQLSFLTIESPKSVGLSDDKRELGIRVQRLMLRRHW